MSVSIGRSLACSCSSSSFVNYSSTNRRAFGTSGRCYRSSRFLKTTIKAQQRPTWLPGLDPPPYLDGTWALRITIQHLMILLNLEIFITLFFYFIFLLLCKVLWEILGLTHLDLERTRRAWSGMCKLSWFIPVLPWLELLEFFSLMWVPFLYE